MRILSGIIIGVVAVVMLAFISGLVYRVDETQQVVITQFGRPVGNAVTQPGLHFKTPLIQVANYFDKRLLQWDGDPNQIPTKDKKYIWVDVTARWKISDPLKFLQSVNNEISAQARLDDIINSATRDVITGHILIEAIRSTNRIFEGEESDDVDVIASEEAIERIGVGRKALEGVVLTRAKKITPQYGIDIVDVRIKRINYIENVRKKVYERMIAERKRAAERYRSEGQGKRAEIDGQREKELKVIQSEAYKTAQGIQGRADAEAINIYAEAYNKDPDFYTFLKTLETYKETIDENTTMMLSTDSDYYKYLKKLE
ncbi:MAG: protease modulator HflC [Candidatus Omnitrophota bacterium]